MSTCWMSDWYRTFWYPRIRSTLLNEAVAAVLPFEELSHYYFNGSAFSQFSRIDVPEKNAFGSNDL